MVTQKAKSGNRRSVRALTGGAFGNILEWYDFFLYGTASALVFNELFFPQYDPLAGTVAAFAVYGIGFAARPLGGVVLGNLGDRIGRKPVLMVTLVLMGVSTFLMGLLPTYESVGLLAPLLLIFLRLVQGFSTGGEWGGASALVIEHAPGDRRGLFSGIVQSGISVGFLLSTLAMQLATMLPDEAFMSWGWRIPFLASVLVAAVGIWIRRGIAETDEFLDSRKDRPRDRIPVLNVLRSSWREVLVTIGLRLAENSSSYVIATFGIVYATSHADVEQDVTLMALVIASVVQIPMMIVWGALSDRTGRKTVYLLGVVMLVLGAFPFFWLINIGTTVAVCAAMVIGFGVIYSAMSATQACFFSELFPTHVRQSGISLGHELGAVIAGGLSPLIATSLLLWADSSWPVSVYLVILGALTLLSLAFTSETRDRDLADIRQARKSSPTPGPPPVQS